jgi:hypothetical protein
LIHVWSRLLCPTHRSDNPVDPAESSTSTTVPLGSIEQPTESSAVATPTQEDADRLIAEGKKLIALKQWEEGAAKYADALEVMYVFPLVSFLDTPLTDPGI